MTLLPLLVVFGLGTLSAILTISRRNPLHSAFYLILTLLSVATSFLFLKADFLAMVQVILYAGAIMVLIIFVLLLTAVEEVKKIPLFHRQTPLALLISGGLIAEIVYTLLQRRILAVEGPPVHSMEALGKMLFKEYGFPFELASILLLVSLVATVVIAKKEGPS
ncbi:MAG: NADH-quinone oxidoreductase subunit J [Candidatus Omnitrophica bacterium]|nr:NADH-quinone oxidoreductase subunit J [Candidatus Omnitrophota bacterium]